MARILKSCVIDFISLYFNIVHYWFVLKETLSSTSFDVIYLQFVLNLVKVLNGPISMSSSRYILGILISLFYSTYIQINSTDIFLFLITIVFFKDLSSHSTFVVNSCYVCSNSIRISNFKRNTIQFRTHQIPEAATNQLSAFEHWYYWLD